MTPSRRELIAGGAALAALGASPLRAQRTGGKDADVIVVGAGMSGLNAAWLLEQQGMKVLLLEGRKRVGGRVFTLFDEPGYPEMGFNNMAAGYGRGIDAAKRAGVELVDGAPRFRFQGQQELVLGGRVIPRAAWPGDPANPFPPALKASMPWEVVNKLVGAKNPLKAWQDWYQPVSAKLDIPMHDFLKAQGLNDAAIQLAMDVVPYHGTTSYDVSALMYEYSDGWTRDQIAAGNYAPSIRDGNMHLPIAMAKLLKGEILFGKGVVGVTSDAKTATVTCEDGSRHTAAHVVMAIPFATLREVKVEPALTGLQAEAVRMLPYQSISIMFIRVAKPFWEEDRLAPSMWTDGPAGWVAAQRFGKTPEEVTGLMVQARGELAHRWERMGDEAAKAMVVAEIERLRPAAKGKLRATFLQQWGLERFNGGDWSYLAPGQARLISAMAKPAGRVHFAGEHTAPLNRGLEAALDSSERVAIEVAEMA